MELTGSQDPKDPVETMVPLVSMVLRDLLDPKAQMEKRVTRDQKEKRVCQESSG